MSAPKKASYHSVHYLLRPAKNIQRKMLCQLFQRLGRYHRIEDYRYVGFGSVYFGDFVLFHRALGISHMTTIEGNAADEERFRFNAPFKCIDFLFGRSSEKLDAVSWDDRPTIVWLDYDYGLEESVLFDVKLAVRRAQPLSVFLITIDGEQKTLGKPYLSNGEEVAIGGDQFRELGPKEKLVAKLGSGASVYLPDNVDLRGDGLCDAYRLTITNAVQAALAERNQGLSERKRLRFVQLVNFRYADGNEMMTWGGVLVEEGHELEQALAQADISTLDFVKAGSDPFVIAAPKLTFKEIRELNKHMPAISAADVPLPLLQEDIEDYMKVYRYFPSFTEAEV
jgi:hypothetical protein